MPDSTSYQLYKAYVSNVTEFLTTEKEIRKIINRGLKEKKENTVKIQTKLYALLYSTYSESSFMKMILTPYGFEQNFVNEILSQDSIQDKWFKVLDLAFLKFTKFSKNSDIPNKKQKLKKIITNYVIDPSIIRNKIAHGQISIALNKKNTALNLDISQKIDSLDYVKIYIQFEIHKKLVSIIEDLIESPEKAHYNYYFTKFQELEKFIEKSKDWTTETKMKTNGMKKPIIRKKDCS